MAAGYLSVEEAVGGCDEEALAAEEDASEEGEGGGGRVGGLRPHQGDQVAQPQQGGHTGQGLHTHHSDLTRHPDWAHPGRLQVASAALAVAGPQLGYSYLFTIHISHKY